MGEIRTLGKSGDSKLMWNAENADEVDAARNMFNELKEKRYIAFSVKKSGNKGKRIWEFDPTAERIIMAPPMRGG